MSALPPIADIQSWHVRFVRFLCLLSAPSARRGWQLSFDRRRVRRLSSRRRRLSLGAGRRLTGEQASQISCSFVPAGRRFSHCSLRVFGHLGLVGPQCSGMSARHPSNKFELVPTYVMWVFSSYSPSPIRLSRIRREVPCRRHRTREGPERYQGWQRRLPNIGAGRGRAAILNTMVIVRSSTSRHASPSPKPLASPSRSVCPLWVKS
jgi:hypothetical protein